MSDISNIKQIGRLTDNQDCDEAFVRLLLNKVYVVNVNKKNLIRRSLYFRAVLTSPCKVPSRFLEVNFETSRSNFKQVARYIEKGSIHFSKNGLFEIYKLADHLQMPALQQLCLDRFVFGLTAGNVENRLRRLEEHEFSGSDDFKRAALQLKRSGKFSFSGIYFLAVEGRNRQLKRYCAKTNSVHDVDVDFPEKKRFELERFSTTIAISCPEKQHAKNENSLLLYDIVSGKVDRVSAAVADDDVSTDDEDSNQTVICSSNDRLFVVSVAESFMVASCLSLSIYEKVGGKVALAASETFYQPFEGKWPVFGKMYLLFAYYFDNKVFVFYCEDKYENIEWKQIEITSELYMMTMCISTLSVVKNEKVLIENPTFDKMFLNVEKFQQCFYDEKEQKLLINISPSTPTFSFSGLPLDFSRPPMLFFDVIKQRFRVRELGVGKSLHQHFKSSGCEYKVLLAGSVLYAFYPRWRYTDGRHENSEGMVHVATFRYEDCKMSGGKTVLKSEDLRIVFDDRPDIESVCLA